MTGWQLALVIAGGWLVLAAIVGLVVGRIVRNRNRQEPQPEEDEDTQPGIPEQRSANRSPRRHAQHWPYRRKK